MLFVEVKHNDTQLFVCELDSFAVNKSKCEGVSKGFSHNVDSSVYVSDMINRADEILVLSFDGSSDYHIVNKKNIKLRIYSD